MPNARVVKVPLIVCVVFEYLESLLNSSMNPAHTATKKKKKTFKDHFGFSKPKLKRYTHIGFCPAKKIRLSMRYAGSM